MRSQKNKRSMLNLVLALIVIVLPFLVIAVYLMTVAQDRYTSESVVVVKQVGEASSADVGGLGVLLGANNTSVEDSRYLKAYIESPDMLNRLDQKLDFRQVFQGDGSDPVFQLAADVSNEELLKYYRRRLSVSLNEQNNLLTVVTQGFSADFTYQFNQALLEESERFINEISQGVAREQLEYAEVQLQDAAARLSEAKEKLITYQNQSKMFDPMANAEAIATLVAGFQAQLAELKTQERTLLSYLNPDTPQVIALRSQITALQQQIAVEQSKLTSNSGTKLNRQAVQFESLKADVEFATDLYRVSLAALEKSRLEAARKLKNLVVISSPQLPQQAMYPRKLYILTSSLMVLVLLYGVICLTLSVIRDHRD
ncbi:MAG: capsule biosynthesis protein [Pseudomonadota bacterium]|nr:capsule biosynthesis protein [Pseudomonadota bacterium]